MKLILKMYLKRTYVTHAEPSYIGNYYGALYQSVQKQISKHSNI